MFQVATSQRVRRFPPPPPSHAGSGRSWKHTAMLCSPLPHTCFPLWDTHSFEGVWFIAISMNPNNNNNNNTLTYIFIRTSTTQPRPPSLLPFNSRGERGSGGNYPG